MIDKYTCTVDGPTPTTQVPTSTITTAGSTGSPGMVSTSTRSGTPISTASGTPRSSPGPDHKEPEGELIPVQGIVIAPHNSIASITESDNIPSVLVCTSANLCSPTYIILHILSHQTFVQMTTLAHSLEQGLVLACVSSLWR